MRPNEAEKKFLSLAYNRFYDIFEEIISDSFWKKDKWYRFCKIRDAFTVYNEIINYEPIKLVLDWMKNGGRPPMEGVIAKDLFKFIRNTINHFPFFESWDDIWVNSLIINWNKKGQFIDRFLTKYKSKDEVKYRFWREDKKQMTYLSINYPKNYTKFKKIYLKDIISEKEGILFSIILMRRVIDTQIER